jgi:hypothetical protein
MNKKIRAALSGALALALGIAGVGIGIASSRQADDSRAIAPRHQKSFADESGDAAGADDKRDNQEPITGAALQKASDAALSYLADRGLQGRVSDTEQGDEQSYYEVEVTLASGRQLDVHLDRDFTVLSAEGDGQASDR